MPDDLQQWVIQAVESEDVTIDAMQKLSAKLTTIYAQAVKKILQKMCITPDKIAAIGLHGQTLHHRPLSNYPYTVQLGNAAVLANQFGIKVIDGFRMTDISVGGQGAPLIPAYHRYLAQVAGRTNAVFLNLGGIANMTLYAEPDTLMGWDIGPANALIDLWCQQHRGCPFDEGGQWARSGKLLPKLLAQWLQDDYFVEKPPKSTGRDYFSAAWLQRQSVNIAQYAPGDVQATLCELTAVTVAQDVTRYVKQQSDTIYLYGKGIANTWMLARLQAHLPGYQLQSTDSLGIAPDWLEGGLFAWLAYQYVSRRPTCLMGVTGAKKPAILGVCHDVVR